MIDSVKEVKAVCRKCGRSSAAERFVLDHNYKMVVCEACSKNRKTNETSLKKDDKKDEFKKTAVEVFEKKSYDLSPKTMILKETKTENTYRKINDSPNFERIDESKIKMTCSKCKYKFIYDTYKNYPRTCPYCNNKVSTVGLI